MYCNKNLLKEKKYIYINEERENMYCNKKCKWNYVLVVYMLLIKNPIWCIYAFTNQYHYRNIEQFKFWMYILKCNFQDKILSIWSLSNNYYYHDCKCVKFEALKISYCPTNHPLIFLRKVLKILKYYICLLFFPIFYR